MPSFISVIRTSVSSLPVALEQVLDQVVGQRPRRHDALLGEGDRGGLDGADPDRQVAVPRHLAQQHDGLVGGHLHPDTDHVDFAHTAHPTPGRKRAVRSGPWRSGPRRPALTSVACSRTDSAAICVIASSARAAPRRRGRGASVRHDLLDEADLAVRGGLERPQVPRLEAERRELAGGLRDHAARPRRTARSRCAGATRPKVSSCVEQRVLDLGGASAARCARAAARRRRRRTTPATGSRRRRAPPAAPAGPRRRSAPAARGRGRWRRGARGSP